MRRLTQEIKQWVVGGLSMGTYVEKTLEEATWQVVEIEQTLIG